jgi:hypothetical protein
MTDTRVYNSAAGVTSGRTAAARGHLALDDQSQNITSAFPPNSGRSSAAL